MKKTNNNLIILTSLFCVCLTISNMIGSKLILTNVFLWGSEVLIPSTVVCYSVTFLITDIVGEIWGKKEASLTVYTGFMIQIVSLIVILIIKYLPGSDDSIQQAYITLLDKNPYFVMASLLAFIVSQTWDVCIFHSIRKLFSKKNIEIHKVKWIWNNISTISSQILDTVIYSFVAFGIGLGWVFNKEQHKLIFGVIIGQYIVKVVIAILDTIPFYYFTRYVSYEEDDL